VTATDTAAIQAAMDKTGGAIWLQPGTYSVANLVPTHNVVIHGYDSASIISMDAGATGWLLDGSTYGVRLVDVVLDGGLSVSQSGASAAGTRSGVQFNATVRNSGCFGCTIRGFSNIGIGLNGTGSLRSDTPVISVANVYWNYLGLETRVGASGTAGEYSRVVASSFSENRIGIEIASGNTNVVGNSINDNGYGVKISSDTNAGHGSLIGNSINHSTVYSIYSQGFSNGFEIIGNSIWYGDIFINGTQGVTLSYNTIAANVYLQGLDPGGNTATGNKLSDPSIINFTGDWDVYDNVRIDTNAAVLSARTLRISPQYTLGADQVTNGSFSSDTGWTHGVGWTIAGGVATASNDSSYMTQLLGAGVTTGANYAITYTVTAYTSGTIVFGIGGNSINLPRIRPVGTYVEYFYLPSGDRTLYIQGKGVWSITGVKVQKVTPADGNTIPTACTGVQMKGMLYSNSGVLTLCP
jgi:hypothetical protein